jgi:hypothetical protein
MANPNKPRDRPSVPMVLPLIRAVYDRHMAGCCLHILTDDFNVEDECAVLCLEGAREHGHPDCIAAAEMLVQMTTTQRRKAAHQLWTR